MLERHVNRVYVDVCTFVAREMNFFFCVCVCVSYTLGLHSS